ncbi:MAG: hypothetical protein E6Q92_02535 [Burkholderiaceae bacterium]|nr:MAG: hypothetical protein E6Q92_02535 [Burkholderiaceae bacterium]
MLLRAWAGGQQLSVPRKVDQGHILCRLLGESAFRRLVEAHGPDGLLFVPACRLDAVVRTGVIHRLGAVGLGSRPISQYAGCTERQVQRLQSHLRGTGRLFGLDEDGATVETAPAPARQQTTAEASPPVVDLLTQLRAARLNHEKRDREYAD